MNVELKKSLFLNDSKHRIAMSFSEKITNYNKYAQVQKRSADFLMQCIIEKNILNINSVFEIGCGSGLLTNNIIKYHNNITCLDISKKSIEYINDKFNNVKTICEDFETYNFTQNYDLIVSNFTLQWMNDFYYCLNKIMQNGKNIALSIPLDSSFTIIKEIYEQNNLINTFLKLPNLEEITDYLNNINRKFIIKKYTDEVRYDNLHAFLKTLKNVGADYSNRHNNANKIRKIINQYDKRMNVNYDVLCILM